MKLAAASCLGLFATSSFASPPPIPPHYVIAASDVLADQNVKDQARVASLFADDVSATENGAPLASGKKAWLGWWSSDREHHYGSTFGYSQGSQNSGSLLIVEMFDTVDWTADPPPPGGPRPRTRAILYQFGPDQLIHSVQISEVYAGFDRLR